MKRTPHILITRFSALGDVAMTIPAIYSLARQYPELKVTVATRPFFARLFINRPANVEVFPVDYKTEYKGVRGTLRLLRRLHRLRPTHLADLHNVTRSWVIDASFLMSGVRRRMVNKNRGARKELFSKKVAQRNYIDRYADVFARLGFPVSLTFTSIFDGQPAPSPLEPRHPAVGVAPFARYYNKAYPVELMREVVDKLAAKGVNVYLFGGRGQEADELVLWANDNPRIHNVAGRFQLEEELALMSQLDVMVSMDSANQHLAALAGTPVITLWGSTTPACGFMAYRQKESDAIVSNLPCQPCSVAGGPVCPLGHFDCMVEIRPQTVVDRIMAKLKSEGNV